MMNYESSGREPHVFRADKPNGLLGIHRTQIAASIEPHEKIYYLINAPIREAHAIPFGIKAEPASHAVAVTQGRFIVSRNSHRHEEQPTIHSIPFPNIAFVELGNSLLLGWTAIHYSDADRSACLSFAFNAKGFHHFVAAIRAYRCLRSHDPAELDHAGHSPVVSPPQTPPKEEIPLLQAILTENEQIEQFFNFEETWYKPRKRGESASCLTPKSMVAITNHGLIHIIEQPPLRPKMISFGINACFFTLDTVDSVQWIRPEDNQPLHFNMRFGIKIGCVSFAHNLCFNSEQIDVAKELQWAMRNKKSQGT